MKEPNKEHLKILSEITGLLDTTIEDGHARINCAAALSAMAVLQKRIDELEETNRKLNFMIENGLGHKDMENDIKYPNEL